MMKSFMVTMCTTRGHHIYEHKDINPGIRGKEAGV